MAPLFIALVAFSWYHVKPMFEKAIELIKKANTIIIHRHQKPDGDAIGAQVGLKNLILDNYPQKKVYAVGDSPERYGFIEGSMMDEVEDDVFLDALSIILDTSAPQLISDNRYTSALMTLRIDHHLFVERIADAEIVDPSFESCAGEIAFMAIETGLSISSVCANALYTGMVTDSGRFQYDSTTSRTFSTASVLLKAGADIATIYSSLYVDDFLMMRRKAEYTLKIQFTDNLVAYVYMTEKELQQTGLDAFSVSRGMVNTMANIKGTKIWVSFTESNKKVLCELRSSGPDINPIAVKYGGGGHKKASGATIADHDTAMKMLEDLNRMAGEYI